MSKNKGNLLKLASIKGIKKPKGIAKWPLGVPKVDAPEKPEGF